MGKKRKLVHPAAGRKPKPGAGGKVGGKASGTSQRDSHPDTATPGASSSPSSTTIPFDPEDDAILLVGEGDLSFAASLADHHGCQHLTATVLEDGPDALAAKYPQAAGNAARIEAAGGRVLYGVDARTMGPWTTRSRDESRDKSRDKSGTPKRGAMDRILFNFPHVGGKSTDVHRQVRHNQELLAAFFQRVLLSLAPGGSVVVTLFEGEPYASWDIRALGRAAGLQVQRSFRFHFAAYPGYHHARTLGVVVRRQRPDSDKAAAAAAGAGAGAATTEASTTAWRGEDRAARSYVFVRKDEDEPSTAAAKKRKRRPGGDSSDSGDDDDDSDDSE